MRWLWGLTLCALVCCGVVIERKVRSIESRLETLLSEERPMSTTWTSLSGTHTLETPQDTDESVPDWMARHSLRLSAAQAQFPPL